MQLNYLKNIKYKEMNKLKKIMISIAILASIIFTIPKVNADSNHINSKGVTIPIEKYNYFRKLQRNGTWKTRL